MPDDTSNRGAGDRARINIHQEHELRDWARKFNATPQQIQDAVARVGTLAADVEMDLKGSRSTSNADAERKSPARTSGR
jgi:hypothetical protein